MPYDAPTPALLRVRYPAFDALPDETIQYRLTDAERTVDLSWMAADYPVALMALAAHNLAGSGALTTGGNIPAGVTSFRSGSFSVAFSDKAAELSAEGGYGTTRYGQEFAALLQRNKGGVRVTGGGVLPCGAGYRASLMHGLS